jgi:hypothetical protein
MPALCVVKRKTGIDGEAMVMTTRRCNPDNARPKNAATT